MIIHNSVTLRAIEENDLEKMRLLRNDPTTWIHLTDVRFIDSESQKKWFQSLVGRNDRTYLAIQTETDRFVGIVRIDEIDRNNRSMRVGADILPELRGKGLGSRTYDALLKYCFDYENVHRVWLAVLDTNQTAYHLYLKKGFTVEGRYREAILRGGKFHDYVLMSILEPEYRSLQQNK